MTSQLKSTVLITLILSIAFCVGAAAQNMEQSYLDSLGDESLLTLFDKNNGDSTAQEKIARTYLDRARRQKDTIKMARGYDRLARIFHPEKNIRFADSVIEISKNQKHITYPAMGYILKGFELISSDLSESTKNYYKAYEIAKENSNIAQQVYLMDELIVRKIHWGNVDEALEMQRKKHKIVYHKNFKTLLLKTTRKGYIHDIDNFLLQLKFNSNITYAISYIHNKKIDSARVYLKKSIDISSTYNGYAKDDQILILKEVLNEIYFYSGLYEKCIKISENIIKTEKSSSNYNSLYDAFYFKGMSQLKLTADNKGIIHLLKADSIFDKHKIAIVPYQRNVFSELLKFYETKKDYSNQIKYHRKLAFSDSIFKKNLAFYESSIKKEIQTPAIIAKKDDLIFKLQKESETPDTKLYIALSLLTATLSLLIFYTRKRFVYKKRFEKLLAQKNTTNVVALNEKSTQNELSNEIVEDILEKLNRFERQHKFLNSDITLQNLAKKFKTNANYLSRVINLKEKNFSQYLHELRIAYAVEELFSHKSYRKYTIKAIAEECGYKNAESFSKAFYKLHGIYPSYYLKKIDRNVG